MSIAVHVESRDLERINAKILKLSRVQISDMLPRIGAEVVSQTQVRFGEEKKSPDGKRWKQWSENYAGTKHGRSKLHGPHPEQLRKAGGHSILELSGDLLDSIQWDMQGDDLLVGSNEEYARTHHLGDDGRKIPARPFLGLSNDNVEDLEDIMIDFIEGVLR